MASLVCDDRFERKIFDVVIAIKRFSIHDQEIIRFRCCQTKLGTTSLTEYMPILDAAYKTHPTRNSGNSPQVSGLHRWPQWFWLSLGH